MKPYHSIDPTKKDRTGERTLIIGIITKLKNIQTCFVVILTKDFAIGVELNNTGIATEPQIATAIFFHPMYRIIRQTFIFTITGKRYTIFLITVQTGQTIAGAEPQTLFTILQNTKNIINRRNTHFVKPDILITTCIHIETKRSGTTCTEPKNRIILGIHRINLYIKTLTSYL